MKTFVLLVQVCCLLVAEAAEISVQQNSVPASGLQSLPEPTNSGPMYDLVNFLCTLFIFPIGYCAESHNPTDNGKDSINGNNELKILSNDNSTAKLFCGNTDKDILKGNVTITWSIDKTDLKSNNISGAAAKGTTNDSELTISWNELKVNGVAPKVEEGVFVQCRIQSMQTDSSEQFQSVHFFDIEHGVHLSPGSNSTVVGRI